MQDARIPLRHCKRCNGAYDYNKSHASLKLTYCNSLCEQADLGFTIEALLRMERNTPTPV
jgi:hypothetical protein